MAPIKTTKSKVLVIKHLTPTAYVVRLEKNGFQFKAGQYLVLTIPGKQKAREYSIYNSIDTDYIDLLIKEVDPGEVSKEIKNIELGTEVELAGPYGFFVLRDSELAAGKHFTFVATGTGISPFHSMILTYPQLNYKLIHGTRNEVEAYDAADYSADRYINCTSKTENGNFNGRVTDYILAHEVDKNSIYYLCGNSDMVNEVTIILEHQGIMPGNIRTEIFF